MMRKARWAQKLSQGPRLVAIFMLCLVLYVYLHISARDQKSINIDEEDTEEIKQYIREAETENVERLRRMQQVCHQYNLGLYTHSKQPQVFKHPPTPLYSVFYIDREHKLSWCPIYKAASTTWLYNLCLLGGYTEEFLASSTQQLSELARRIYPELDSAEAEEALGSTLKLLVVRHPFARLLSAYRDKLENSEAGREHGSLHYYKRYGSKIVAKYRKGGNLTHTKDLLSPGSYYWNPNRLQPAGVEPTFKEFVRYLIDLDLLNYADDHWMPYYLYCTPCLLKYDIIGKVETMLRDQVYTIRAAGLQGLIRPRWRHKSYHGEVDEFAKKYFSQLTKDEVRKLYKKYRLDFDLFDYKVDEYLKYAIDG